MPSAKPKKYTSLDNFLTIGSSVKSFGKDGLLLVDIDSSYTDLFKEVEALFLEYKANIIPFFIEKIKPKGEHYLIQFDGVNGPEYWSDLSDYRIRIHKRDLDDSLVKSENISGETLDGFLLIDSEKGAIAKITEIREFPQQLMGVIQINQEEILIPLVENWIVSVNLKRKELHMDLPDGILNIT